MGETRGEKRNRLANDVCREVRYQINKYGGIAENIVLYDLLIKWMSVAKKDKYVRPK